MKISNINKGKIIKILIVLLVLVVIGVLVFMLYKEKKEAKQVSQNNYNRAFYELVDYVQNIETYLAKSLISSSAEHGAETLTNLWREANLAQSYLSMLPIESEELENTEKFLNQVSDYSYSLSRKNINHEELTEDDLNNLKELHDYSVELNNTLNQLSEDLNSGRVNWDDLTAKDNLSMAQQVDNISKESFSNLEENFHEYSGLIYDGAFSEHITSLEKKGLTGDDVDEETAKQTAIDFVGNDNVEKIESLGVSENADISAYDFSVTNKNKQTISIAISKKGAHVIYMNSNREVNTEIISEEEAVNSGKNFLESKQFNNMKETYYLKEGGIETINYAYVQDNVVMYTDLIKVKVALDNGEIIGIETTGYLNNHTVRQIKESKITIADAKANLNKNLDIESEGLAVIPTKWHDEILCYEFKGKVEEREFLVYINVETGKEEDILIITNTPNGTLVM